MDDTGHNPTVAAIVVSRNEGHRLDACLARLHWCDELIVVDLESTDATRQVAARHATRVLQHPFSPIVEPVRCFAAAQAKSEWLLFVDPDEQIPALLAQEIRAVLRDHPRAGVIRLPWLFHFKGKPLHGTVWGGFDRSKRFMAHRDRAVISPLSQSGIQLRDCFEELTIEPRDGNHVRHDWADSYIQLFEKHVRLAWHDGKPRHEKGMRFRRRDLCIEPLRAFRYCLIARDGWREGPRGFVLSLVYALYQFIAALSLARYARRAGKHNDVHASTNPVMRKAA